MFGFKSKSKRLGNATTPPVDLSPVTSHCISSKQITINPTRHGYYFLGIAIVLFMAAFNYKNSLMYFLCFMMLSLFLVSLLYGYKNLMGLQLSPGSTQSVFAGEPVLFPIRLAGRRSHYNITIDSQSGPVHIQKNDDTIVQLIRPTIRRGALPLGVFKVSTSYPLGLIQSTCWVHLAEEVLIYPKPLAPDFPPPKSMAAEGHGEERLADTGDFYGVRDYQPGDRMNQIAWKMVSKEQGLYCKMYAESVSQSQLFSLPALSQYPLETALSYLCHWLLDAHRSGQSFGLDLGTQQIPLGVGDRHLHTCLTQLAKV